MRRRSLFFVVPSTGVTPDTISMVRDFAALGYAIVPVLDGAQLTPSERFELADALRASTGARIATVLDVGAEFDPRPVWDAARVHALDLQRSLLVTQERRLSGLFQTAGVTRVSSPARVRALHLAA